MILSTLASCTLEDVAAASRQAGNGRAGFSSTCKPSEHSAELVHRAEAAGYEAIVTTDAP